MQYHLTPQVSSFTMHCPDHASIALEPKKYGWYCPACNDVVVTYEEAPRDATQQLAPTAPPSPDASSALPTLLALPLRELVHASHPVLALWAACDLVEIALRLCVMSGLAEHRALPDALVRELRPNVEVPTLGKWLAMALAVEKHAPKNSVLPALPATVRSIQALFGRQDATPELGLLALRNRLAHGGPVARAEARRLSALWMPRVLSWAGASLRWLDDTALVAIDVDGRCFEMRGERGAEARVVPALLADALPGSAWLCVGEHVLPLGPLAAFDPDHRAMLVYVRCGEVRLQYLRLGDEGRLGESGPDAHALFRKRFAPSANQREAGAGHHVVHGFESEIRREAARREGREVELATLFSAIHAMDGGMLWVAGPAGIGKSNLMAAVMEALTDAPRSDTLVLYVSASRYEGSLHDPEHAHRGRSRRNDATDERRGRDSVRRRALQPSTAYPGMLARSITTAGRLAQSGAWRQQSNRSRRHGLLSPVGPRSAERGPWRRDSVRGGGSPATRDAHRGACRSMPRRPGTPMSTSSLPPWSPRSTPSWRSSSRWSGAAATTTCGRGAFVLLEPARRFDGLNPTRNASVAPHRAATRSPSGEAVRVDQVEPTVCSDGDGRLGHDSLVAVAPDVAGNPPMAHQALCAA
ncbi:MAG: hypothetical protein H6716_26990 [Polyangiaceae bacterium]|nr:hypothetical protein [Polyangiaceae bacterium]